jgi:hypothetical protein
MMILHNVIMSLYTCIVHAKGAELEVYVTTTLPPDGIFWAQLSLDDPDYDAMAEELKLKLSESRDIMTPVFFNTGDLCAGLFSEDESWYRARVVSAREGMVSNMSNIALSLAS